MVSSLMPPSISTRIVSSPASTSLRDGADLAQHLGDETLAAEAGLDRHDEQGVEVRQDFQVRLQRGARLDADPGLGARGADVAGHPDRVVGGLGVEGDVVGARFGVRRRPAVRVVDHQMAIHRDGRGGQQALHHRQADRQVRHEVAVHHIDVQPVGAGHGGRLVGEPGEIGGQDGRRYQRSHRCLPGMCARLLSRRRSSRQAAQRGGEHGVGAVPVRPQLDVGPLPQLGRRARTAAGCPARTPGDGAARRRPPRRFRRGAANRSHRAPRRRAGSARSRRPAARVAAWPAPARRPAGAANAPPAGAATRPARCRARRRAPGRSPARDPVCRPSTRSTSTGSPRVFCATRSARRGDGSTAVTRAPELDAQARPAARSCRPARRTGPATARCRRRPAPASAPGPPTGCPRPEPAPAPSRTGASCPGSPPGRYTAYGEYRPTLPPTASASSAAVSTPGRAARCTWGRSSSLASTASSSVGGRAQRVGEGLGDPARVRAHEGGVSDRIPRRVGGQLVDPGLLVSSGDGSQHAVDETRSRRIEFDAGLFDRGGHRGVRVDPGAQQLVGAEPQQVEQHRVDRFRRAFRRPHR